MLSVEENATNTDSATELSVVNLVEDFQEKLKVKSPSPSMPKNDSTNANVIFYNIENDTVEYVNYRDERQMPDIMRLIQKDLSEPYSIYTYRYFIHNWPQLCFLVSEFLLSVTTFTLKYSFSLIFKKTLHLYAQNKNFCFYFFYRQWTKESASAQ